MFVKRWRVCAWLLLLQLLFIAPCASLSGAAGQDVDAQLALARIYFQEATTICGQDRGRLWRVSLCGPMLFVDAQTRTVFANQADAQGQLTKRGEVFTGRLPAE